MTPTPDKFRKYEADWRDDDVAAMMAIIEQLGNVAGQLEELNHELREGRR